MPKTRALVVDDEAAVRNLEVAVLEAEGHEVRAAADGFTAIEMIAAFRPQVVVLDIGLPGGLDGLTLARRLRSSGPVGIVFVTGADRLEDRITGLDAGGDDYLVKPFAPGELAARVRAVLRRTESQSGLWELGNLTVDESARTMKRDGQAVCLTSIEWDLFSRLLHSRGHVVTQAQLLADVWGYGLGHLNVLHAHISALRQKLGVDARGDGLIHTVRSTGYVLRPPRALQDPGGG